MGWAASIAIISISLLHFCTISEAVPNTKDFSGFRSEWIEGPDKNVYLFERAEDTWRSAREYCLAHNSDLIVIKSEWQKNWILAHYEPAVDVLGERLVFVGLLKKQNEEWTWVDNQPFNESLPSSSNDIRCAAMKASNAELVDVPCYEEPSEFHFPIRFVCERSGDRHTEQQKSNNFIWSKVEALLDFFGIGQDDKKEALDKIGTNVTDYEESEQAAHVENVTKEVLANIQVDGVEKEKTTDNNGNEKQTNEVVTERLIAEQQETQSLGNDEGSGQEIQIDDDTKKVLASIDVEGMLREFADSKKLTADLNTNKIIDEEPITKEDYGEPKLTEKEIDDEEKEVNAVLAQLNQENSEDKLLSPQKPEDRGGYAVEGTKTAKNLESVPLRALEVQELKTNNIEKETLLLSSESLLTRSNSTKEPLEAVVEQMEALLKKIDKVMGNSPDLLENPGLIQARTTKRTREHSESELEVTSTTAGTQSSTQSSDASTPSPPTTNTVEEPKVDILNSIPGADVVTAEVLENDFEQQTTDVPVATFTPDDDCEEEPVEGSGKSAETKEGGEKTDETVKSIDPKKEKEIEEFLTVLKDFLNRASRSDITKILGEKDPSKSLLQRMKEAIKAANDAEFDQLKHMQEMKQKGEDMEKMEKQQDTVVMMESVEKEELFEKVREMTMEAMKAPTTFETAAPLATSKELTETLEADEKSTTADSTQEPSTTPQAHEGDGEKRTTITETKATEEAKMPETFEDRLAQTVASKKEFVAKRRAEIERKKKELASKLEEKKKEHAKSADDEEVKKTAEKETSGEKVAHDEKEEKTEKAADKHITENSAVAEKKIAENKVENKEAKKTDDAEKAEKAEKVEKAETAEKAEKAAKAEKAEEAEKAEKVEKIEKAKNFAAKRRAALQKRKENLEKKVLEGTADAKHDEAEKKDEKIAEEKTAVAKETEKKTDTAEEKSEKNAALHNVSRQKMQMHANFHIAQRLKKKENKVKNGVDDNEIDEEDGDSDVDDVEHDDDEDYNDSELLENDKEDDKEEEVAKPKKKANQLKQEKKNPRIMAKLQERRKQNALKRAQKKQAKKAAFKTVPVEGDEYDEESIDEKGIPETEGFEEEEKEALRAKVAHRGQKKWRALSPEQKEMIKKRREARHKALRAQMKNQQDFENRMNVTKVIEQIKENKEEIQSTTISTPILTLEKVVSNINNGLRGLFAAN